MEAIEARLYGVDLFGEPMCPRAAGPVAEKFKFPPFSILDARSGDWQERKRAWMSLGIQSEIGREGGLSYAIPTKKWDEDKMAEDYYGAEAQKLNTSIFDPVLTELAYRWWSPPEGRILDPFAGGSVRGIIAGSLGREYHGIDLRPEQVEANRKQSDDIPTDPKPSWVAGDSLEKLDDAPGADFLFSCPPYGDLEVYSDDPADLSNMNFQAFRKSYREIIKKACDRLHDNRFACFVVGDFRDKKGHYRNFVSITEAAFRDAGLHFYNEAILMTSIASASMRVTRQFEAGRKLAKVHQNVLVFVKGDWKKAAAAARGE